MLGRLDVLPTLDGVEPGPLELLLLERAGFTVLNGARALLGCHDKWRTAELLERAHLPHPRTALLRHGGRALVDPPLVVKPRFGSWGVDVERCRTLGELELCLVRAAAKPWFRRHGALLQELVPSEGVDLRIVIARGQIVGAIERVARKGSGVRTRRSGARAARSILPRRRAHRARCGPRGRRRPVGVDLLPLETGGYSVIELNGAVDFTAEYGLGGRDAYGTRSPLGLADIGASIARSRAAA